MVFSSLLFLIMFLPVFLGCYYITPRKYRNLIIFIFSLFFYAWGEPIYVGIMLFSTVFDYSIGILIDKNRDKGSVAKWYMISSIIVNIGMLFFFKYANFLIGSINGAFGMDLALLDLSLPIGISFYTFQTMSYVIDVYRGKASVQRSLVCFGAYISMFPQLIAGPIVTYVDVENDIDNRVESVDMFASGVERFIQGLAKKVLIANNVGMLWSLVLSGDVNMSVVLSWVGIVAFGLQLYFDFSGYSDMAIGLGKMMGFSFPENFNYPYMSKSVTEFWRRWHMTLGGWFREYVYIPLGGNRCSLIRQLVNISTVWFLTGLWHGASWNFVIWGMFFGVIMILEKAFLLRVLKYVPSGISRIYLLVVVFISWALFAIDDIGESIKYIQTMIGCTDVAFINNEAIYWIFNYGVILIIAVALATGLGKKILDRCGFKVSYCIYMILLVVSTAYLVDSTFNPFLYFRF